MSVCKFCQLDGHSAFLCPRKPRKPLATRSKLVTHKPMAKIGKVGKKTAAAMARWKRDTPTNHQGYMECYICHKWVPYKRPEHVRSRARAPELRTDLSNFKPVCDPCNERKGSKDVDEL